ncbi:protein kinase domain-containing protein [Citrus sinensis]|uniref:Protein kinase domain-containing protein n=1 Tax=Citrus sinensis TaxID=2711 RepID=A0ACB8JCL5_CITSI|nr:protein kinase domain-containing protein [Citrus sinensis]
MIRPISWLRIGTQVLLSVIGQASLVMSIAIESVLNISSLNLIGTIPSQLGNLSSLQSLNLSCNRLSGSIPSAIFTTYTLKHVSLGENQLSGQIPTNICSNLPFLEILFLSENMFHGEIPSALSNCTYLIILSLAYNDFSGAVPREIGNLTKLRELYLGCNRLQGEIPLEIGNLQNLEELQLGQNKLIGTVPAAIFNVSTLKFLGLQNNSLSGSLSSIANVRLPNLEKLYLWGNNFSGTIPRFIFNASKLSKLSLGMNSFSGFIPSTFGNLRNLEQLGLDENYLTSSTPELSFLSSLSNCKSLTLIDLSNNPLDGILPKTSISNLSRSLEEFYMYNCNISGGIPEEISNLTNLVEIDLGGNKLNGSIPITLGKLRKLQRLNLEDNILEGSIPDDICRLAELYRLELGSNKLYGSIPACFGNLASLRILSLGSNKLTSIPLTFWNLKDILQLNFSSNFLTGPLLLEIGNLKRRFCSVYKARLGDKMEVAVKVFNLQCGRAFKSFDVECEMMKSIRHRNLIKVISSCSNEEFKALVLEYMPHGSLEKYLYSSNCILDIFQRLNIMIDVASALEYLHFGYSALVIHCDLKPSNVLLDDNMVAHLSDFSIAKLLTGEDQSMTQTQTLGTIGYMAPEYGREGRVSTNGDVYSFGIMLMETFAGKKPTNEIFNEEMTLKQWVNGWLPISTVEVVDPNLLSQEDVHFVAKEQCVSFVFNLAMACTVESPEKRINAKEIVTKLLKIRGSLLRNVGGRWNNNIIHMANDRDRAIRDYAVLTPQAIHPGIVRPDVQADNFELKPVMFHMLQTVGQFNGLPSEDPHLHLKLFLELETFYNGLNPSTRLMVDASANGALLYKSYNEAYEILERIANNNYQWPSTRQAAARGTTGVYNVDDAIGLQK